MFRRDPLLRNLMWPGNNDGNEEFELQDRIPANVQANDLEDPFDDRHLAREEPGERPPRYQVDVMAIIGEGRRRRFDAGMERQARRRTPWTRYSIYAAISFLLLLDAIWLVWPLIFPKREPDCAPGDKCDVGDKGQSQGVEPRRRSGRAFSPAFSAVPGFYMIPATTSDTNWHQLEDKSISIGPWNEQVTLPTPLIWNISGNREDASKPRASLKDTGVGLHSRQMQENFDHWGVEVLYDLHMRTAKRTMQVDKAWCIDNTCDTGKKLDSLCNDTGKDVKKIKKKGKSEQQECDWCWDPAMFPKRNSTQQAAIERHCDVVSRHAAIFLTMVCGLFLLLVIVLTSILVRRLVLRRRLANLDSNLNLDGPGSSPPDVRGAETGQGSTPIPRDLLLYGPRKTRNLPNAGQKPGRNELLTNQINLKDLDKAKVKNQTPKGPAI